MADKPIPGRREKDLSSPELVTRYWDKFWATHPSVFERNGKEALDWFRLRVSKDVRVKASQLIQGQSDYNKHSPKSDRGMIGKLYLFEYDAEEAGDDKTGMYDRFPLVFFFNSVKSKAGNQLLYGLNMHYLLPKERALLYSELMQLKVSKKWTPKTKLKLQWDLIKGVAQHKLIEKAVHAYRVDRVQSRMVEIPAFDWQVCCFLRIEKWLLPKSEHGPLPSHTRKMLRDQRKTATKAKSISRK